MANQAELQDDLFCFVATNRRTCPLGMQGHLCGKPLELVTPWLQLHHPRLAAPDAASCVWSLGSLLLILAPIWPSFNSPLPCNGTSGPAQSRRPVQWPLETGTGPGFPAGQPTQTLPPHQHTQSMPITSRAGGVWSRDIVDTMSRDIVDSGVNYVNGYF